MVLQCVQPLLVQRGAVVHRTPRALWGSTSFTDVGWIKDRAAECMIAQIFHDKLEDKLREWKSSIAQHGSNALYNEMN